MLLASCAIALLGAGANAQSAPARDASASEADGEDIIVTARKRSESLQDTPISVSAFTADMMEQRGMADIADVARRTPGMTYGEFGDIKLSPTSLRGVYSNAGSAGADPAVGYYVDEVFVGQGAGANLDLFDIERVEVLRGPQGTLFGRNTIGGVISITTKRPSDVLEVSLTTRATNYDGVRVAGSFSGPIMNGLSAKLAAIYDKRGGTGRNLFLDQRVNDQQSISLRGQIAYEFNADTDLLVTADYRNVDQHPLMFETLKYNDGATLPFLLDMFGLPRNEDPDDRDVYGDQQSTEELDAGGIAATFRTKIGTVGVTNVASYREHDYFSRTDTERSQLSWIYDGDPEHVRRFSEELRFDASTGSIDWLGGLYYYSQRSSNESFIELGSDLADLNGAPEMAGLRIGSDGILETRSIAGFVSATWNISPTFDVTAGGRYTRDHKEIDYTQSDPLGILGGDASFEAEDSWGQFTPNFNVRYRPTRDLTLYATVAKGFKSGGFNDALGDADGIAFDPEKLWNYEAGVKAELFDRRLSVSAAAYYMDWSSIQITQDDPTTPVFDPIILNGGAAHSTGFEVELSAKPTNLLSIGVTFAVIGAEYDGGTLPDGTKLDKIPFAPSNTGSLFLEQRIPVGSGELVLGGEYIWRGRTYLTPNNDPDGRQPGYGLLNLRASYEFGNGRFRITAFGENVTNKKYMTRLFDSFDQDLVGQKFIVLGDPHIYGIELEVGF